MNGDLKVRTDKSETQEANWMSKNEIDVVRENLALKIVKKAKNKEDYGKSEIFLGRRQGPRPRKIQAKLTSFCFAQETHVRVNAFGFTKRNQVMGGRRRAVFWCVVPGRCARLLLACKRAVLS